MDNRDTDTGSEWWCHRALAGYNSLYLRRIWLIDGLARQVALRSRCDADSPMTYLLFDLPNRLIGPLIGRGSVT